MGGQRGLAAWAGMGTSLPQAVTRMESDPWEQASLIWLELGLTRFQTWWQPLTLPGPGQHGLWTVCKASCRLAARAERCRLPLPAG